MSGGFQAMQCTKDWNKIDLGCVCLGGKERGSSGVKSGGWKNYLLFLLYTAPPHNCWDPHACRPHLLWEGRCIQRKQEILSWGDGGEGIWWSLDLPLGLTSPKSSGILERKRTFFPPNFLPLTFLFSPPFLFTHFSFPQPKWP